jgi:hypothetical protein
LNLAIQPHLHKTDVTCRFFRLVRQKFSSQLKIKIMSLDVYLITKEPQIKKATSGIFVRENGQTKEITQEEWNAKNPNSEPVKFEQEDTETNEVYSANITHNLNTMADEAGIYEHLWRPDEIQITKAKEVCKIATNGLGLYEGKEIEVQMFSINYCSIEIQKSSIALMPFFHKTLVIGCF